MGKPLLSAHPDGHSGAHPAADRYIVPSLVRGLEVLAAFTPERPRLSLAELAAEVGVTRSAMFRIVYTLTQLSFLVHDTKGRVYLLGPAALRLGVGFADATLRITATS